jgi:hypothetical protein
VIDEQTRRNLESLWCGHQPTALRGWSGVPRHAQVHRQTQTARQDVLMPPRPIASDERIRVAVAAATSSARRAKASAPADRTGRASCCATLLLLQDLDQGDLALVEEHDLAIAARELKAIVESTDAEAVDWAVVEVLADRTAAALRPAVARSAARADILQRSHWSATATAEYDAQARSAARTMRLLAAIASAWTAATIAILLAGGAATSSHRHLGAAFAPYVAASAVAATAAVVTAWQAARQRAFSREADRLAVQFTLLDPYLAQIRDPMLRDAARTALLPRMFPRLLEDVDPLREPRWPDLAALVALAATRDDADQEEDDELAPRPPGV